MIDFLYAGSMNPIRVGLIGFDGVMALDLTGPADAFASALIGDDKTPGYEVVLLGVSSRPFVAESGITFTPHSPLSDAPPLDTVIIPGGAGLRVPGPNRIIADWIRKRYKKFRRIASVCTGIYGLAATGLLNGRKVCTHWRFIRDVAQQFPELRVDPDALFCKDGQFYTAAGVTASIDLSLSLIEEDYGPHAALSVARELVVFLKRAGGQEQYSEPLHFQVQAADRFADLLAWMPAHLTENLSVQALAEKTHLSERQFNRRFQKLFGITPATFVRRMRLDEARKRLAIPGCTLDQVASSVGFQSTDSFSRAFEQTFGVPPRSYQRRFAVGGTPRPTV